MVNRPATLCFDEFLPRNERDATARTLRSCGAEVTSWNDAAGRTYAAVVYALDGRFATDRPAFARVHIPPLFVARITPANARHLDALAEALGGDGRPAGMLAVHREPSAVVIELDPVRTPLGLVVGIVDLETGSARSIEPLLPIDDATLTAFCSGLLGEPALDTERLIETYSEPMLIESV